MAASSAVCSWLVAACMSIACENDQSMVNPTSSMRQFSPSKRLSRWARKQRVLSKCGAGGSDHPKGLISSFCGSAVQGLMSSYLAFEPCDEYYNSKGLCPSDFCGGDNGFASLFGSRNVPVTRRRRRRRVNRAVRSGNHVLVWFVCVYCRYKYQSTRYLVPDRGVYAGNGLAIYF